MILTGRRAIALAVLVLVVVSVVLVARLPGGARAVPLSGGNVIGVVYVEGVITSGHSTVGITGSTLGSDTVLQYLRSARQDPDVKAVVVRVNSPGGSAAASQEIAQEMKALSRAGKPVVASMGDVAASGGYLVSSAADAIVADPGTVTGSIGVIMQVTVLEGLYEKLGIDVETVKSGPHKDMAAGDRPLTETERELLQEMVDDVYDQFVDAVVEGRGMRRSEVLRLADGRILTGRQALKAGLVDSLGNLHDAIELAAELAGVEAFTAHEYGRVSPLRYLLGVLASPASPRGTLDAMVERALFFKDLLLFKP